MSQENVEIVRRAFEYEISGRGDATEVLASFDPYVVMKPVEEGASYGVEAIRDNFEHWQSAWENLEVIIDTGDRDRCLLLRGLLAQQGRIVRIDEYAARDEALEA